MISPSYAGDAAEKPKSLYQDPESSLSWLASCCGHTMEASEFSSIIRDVSRVIPKNNVVATQQLAQLVDLMSLPRMFSLLTEWANSGQFGLNFYDIVSQVKSISEIGNASCQAATLFLHLSGNVLGACSVWGDRLGFVADVTDAVQEFVHIKLHYDGTQRGCQRMTHQQHLMIHIVRLAAKATIVACAIFEARIDAAVPGGKQAALLCAAIVKLWSSHREATGVGKFDPEQLAHTRWKSFKARF